MISDRRLLLQQSSVDTGRIAAVACSVDSPGFVIYWPRSRRIRAMDFMKWWQRYLCLFVQLDWLWRVNDAARAMRKSYC